MKSNTKILLGIIGSAIFICTCLCCVVPSLSPSSKTNPATDKEAKTIQFNTNTPFVIGPTDTFTITPTVTITPTITPTNTPLPPATLTAISKYSTYTQVSENLTSTASKVSSNKTSTASSIRATATELAKYEAIDWRELVNYPQNLVGKYIKIHGRVFNIAGPSDFQMFVGNKFDAVYVKTRDPLSGLYEDDWIWIYGIGANTVCGTNTFGAEICQPLISDAFWTR
jgi:hypothetical protein